MVATSDPGDYGKLTVFETPQGIPGPANADSYIQANHTVSSDITLYDQHGSEVLLGDTLMVPVGQAIVYLRPLYVASSSNPLPQLTDVIGVLGQKVVIESTVSATLSSLLHTSVSGGTGTGPSVGTGTVPAAVQQYLNAAQTDYTNALAALEAGDLGTYQSDINAMQQQITDAQAALTATTGARATPATTTTTTTVPTKNKSTKNKTSTTSTTLATAEPSQ
jgi:uncharacterized membrane protein (UPF0182 family)